MPFLITEQFSVSRMNSRIFQKLNIVFNDDKGKFKYKQLLMLILYELS